MQAGISSSIFKSQQTTKSCIIFYKVNCSSAYVIYLMGCTLGKKQYVGKSETSFNFRLNNPHKDVTKPDAILPCRHFQERNHIFNKQAKFTIINKLTNNTKSKDILRQRLIERENLWIQMLEMLHATGLNQKLTT